MSKATRYYRGDKKMTPGQYKNFKKRYENRPKLWHHNDDMYLFFNKSGRGLTMKRKSDGMNIPFGMGVAYTMGKIKANGMTYLINRYSSSFKMMGLK